MAEEILAWLQGFTGEKIHMDDLPEQPGSWGLFPRGQKQISRQEDVLGNVTTRLQHTYILRRVGLKQKEDQALLEQLCRWVAAQSAAKLAPAPVTAEMAQLEHARQTGTGVYSIKLIFNAKEKNNGEN